MQYPALTAATAPSAQVCYDIATLMPAYNPVATVITANYPSIAANAITTLAVFGQALGRLFTHHSQSHHLLQVHALFDSVLDQTFLGYAVL